MPSFFPKSGPGEGLRARLPSEDGLGGPIAWPGESAAARAQLTLHAFP